MKRKNKITFAIIGVLFVLALFVLNRQSSSTLNSKENNFAVSDTASIVKIFLTDKNNHTILLSREINTPWFVNDSLIASQENIANMLETIKSIDVRFPVSDVAHNNVIKQMAVNSTKIEIYQKVHRINLFNSIKLFPYTKNTRTYYVGSESADKLGTYMLMEGAQRPYEVWIPGFRGFVATRYTALLSDWRGHAVFQSKIHDIKSLEMIDNFAPENSFRIEKNSDNTFKIFRVNEQAYLTEFDTTKVIEYLTSYHDIRYEVLMNQYMEKNIIDSIFSSPFQYKITLKKNNGEGQYLTTFPILAEEWETDLHDNKLQFNPERMYGSLNNGRDIVTLQYFVFDKILKPITYFTGEYTEDSFLKFNTVD